jgi:hypothetical protein
MPIYFVNQVHHVPFTVATIVAHCGGNLHMEDRASFRLV